MSASSPLLQKGFLGLILTQFFGAMNDNLLKMVLTLAVASGGLWASKLGDGGQAYVALCLSVPFILLSGFAGQIADRASKQRITLAVKGAEIGIAAVGLAGFWIGNLWLALGAMLLLAIQSAFFGPAKYGMIPELVRAEDLSQANGTINMFTNLAVIAGTVVAGPVYSAFHPTAPESPGVLVGDPLRWVPGSALLFVSLLGFASCLLIPQLKAIDPALKISPNPFGIYLRSIREMARSPLLVVALAWAYFYLLGILALLILPDYRDLLKISETKTTLLAGILGLAIGIGSVAAGLISGKRIEPRLIPAGAAGMAVLFLLLGILPLSYGLVAVLLLGAGMFAGLYIVPLQALLQYLSPNNERGRFLGTANAISFVAITIGNLIFLFLKQVLHLPSNRVFLICSALAVLGTGVLLWYMRNIITDPAVREVKVTD